jgi:hypothetical protein
METPTGARALPEILGVEGNGRDRAPYNESPKQKRVFGNFAIFLAFYASNGLPI